MWQQVKCVDAYRDVPARNCLFFHWGYSHVKQLRLKSLNSHDAERVAKQPWKVSDLYPLGIMWHSCSTTLAPISQPHLFST